MYKLFVILFVISLFTVGCVKVESDPVPVKPTDLISESEAEAAVGDCDLMLQYDAVLDLGDNEYLASYYAEPLGSVDPVIVSVTCPSKEFTNNEIKKLYTDSYSARDNKRKVRGLGAEAFVAFPTLNIYEEGHLIKITAGSGDTQEQLDLLISLGQTAVKNLHIYLSDK